MRISLTLLACLLICTNVFAATPFATDFAPVATPQVDTPLGFPTRIAAAPTIDGKLDDACWQQAEVIGEFRSNMTGLEPLEGSSFKVCYDDRAMYVAVTADEGQMDHLAGKPQGDKQDVWSGDEMELFIAPHGDGKTYYHFCVGALHGQRYDARNDLGREYHDPNWRSAVHLDREAGIWYTEIAIPFSAFELDAPPTNTLWAFNLARQNWHTVPPATDFGKIGGDNSKELTQWSPTGPAFHVLAKFGGLYFGSRESYASRREPMNVSLVLDRYGYDHLDNAGVGLIDVRTGGRDLDEVAAMLTLVSGKNIQAVETAIAIDARTTSFNLPVADLAPGDYKLIATLIAADAQPATAAWDFTVTDQGLAEGVAKSGKITLKLPPRDDDKRGFAWPVRTGVPFPQGALADADHVRLLVNGKPHPAQTAVRATWGPGATVRWLGLSFVVDDPGATYELEYGPNVTPAAASQTVSVTSADNMAAVDTGPLTFAITKAGLKTASLNGNIVVNGNAETAPYLVDESGTVYRTSLSDDVTVEVEEAGPIHAVIRVSGWFASAGGEKLCKFTTYYEAFAGLPHVFVDHAVVLTYDTNTNKLRDIGFPVAASGDDYAFGVMDGDAITGSRGSRAFAVQDRHNHFTAAGQEGEKLAGWADAGSDKLGVTLSGQYVWQRYPLEFSVDDKTLTYHLWPADLGDTFSDEEEIHRANIYKILSAHEGPGMDLRLEKRYFEQVREFAATENVYLIYAKKGQESNAQGLALNEPFVLTFRDKPLDAKEADAFARLNEQSPHAIAEPKWMALTGAMGEIAAVDVEKYPDVARYAGPAFMAMTWPTIESAEDYGKFNFGDVHTYFIPHYKDKKVGLHRVWLNHHHGQNHMPWLLYAYYGDQKYLDWARVSSLHTMNVDIVHYDDPDNPIKFHKTGAMYHVKGFVHWGYDTQLAGHLAWPTYLNWSWLLTGNRRARDVGDEWVEGVIAAQPSGFTGREGQNALGQLANFYQHRFDPRLLKLLDAFATTVKSEPLEKQSATYWNPFTFYMYDRLRRDPHLIDMIDKPAYRIERYRELKLHLTAYLYLRTGDEKYLEPITDAYEWMGAQLVEEDHPLNGWHEYSFREVSNRIHQLFVIQKAFEKAGLSIKPRTDIKRPTIVEDGRYTRNSPQQYNLGVMKEDGKAITIDTAGDAELAKAITITAPSGETVDAIDAAASPGLYTIHVKAGKLVNVKGAEPFFLVRKGQMAGLMGYTLATIEPVEGDGPINLQIRTGDKRPSRVAVFDGQGNEVTSASVWNFPPSVKPLTIPAGGPYTLAAPYATTFTADRDIKLKLISGDQ